MCFANADAKTNAHATASAGGRAIVLSVQSYRQANNLVYGVLIMFVVTLL